MATTQPAVAARTGQQFLDGLRGDAREIWLNGEKITHPLEHPELEARPPARSRACTTSSTSTPTRCWHRRPTTGRLVNVTHLIPRTGRTWSGAGGRSS